MPHFDSKHAIEYLATTTLIPDRRNARKHPQPQQVSLQASISEFGLNVPILIDESNNIIAGHARLLAAQALHMPEVPCVRLTHLTAAQKRALAIADNRIAERAEWDPDALRAEFESLCKLDFPVELTGFATAEIDIILEVPSLSITSAAEPSDAVTEPDRTVQPVSQIGDCWECGEHRLYCGNALETNSYVRLLGDERAAMIITDPPWNVPIHGHVSGLGKVKHREFIQASGELSPAQYTLFLGSGMENMVQFSVDGSLHFIFMDWRAIKEISEAGSINYTELKNVLVWDKQQGSMGSLYRSRHELIFLYKNGKAPHQNNIMLGKYGRNRSNVWSYPGANTFSRTRQADLAAHPTVKNCAMIADAIRDCSKRGDLILDPFAGSGTILLAAERTGRRARAIELDPYYIDTAVRRWQQQTGKSATPSGSDKSFDVIAEERRSASCHDLGSNAAKDDGCE